MSLLWCFGTWTDAFSDRDSTFPLTYVPNDGGFLTHNRRNAKPVSKNVFVVFYTLVIALFIGMYFDIA